MTKFELNASFSLNARDFRTDVDTLNLLRRIIPSAKKTKDSSAVIAIIELGLATGRIVEEAGR